MFKLWKCYLKHPDNCKLILTLRLGQFFGVWKIFDVVIEIFSLIFVMYTYLDKKKIVSFVRVQ